MHSSSIDNTVITQLDVTLAVYIEGILVLKFIFFAMLEDCDFLSVNPHVCLSVCLSVFIDS